MENWWLNLFHLFPIIGIALTILGILFLNRTRRRFKEWKWSKAQVVSLGESMGEEVTCYYPKYNYEVMGVTYEGRGSVASSSPRYQVGEEITIIVNPHNPSQSDVYNREVLYFSAIPLIMGLLFLLIGSVVSYLILSGSFNMLFGA
jgi:hypothetical protein